MLDLLNMKMNLGILILILIINNNLKRFYRVHPFNLVILYNIIYYIEYRIYKLYIIDRDISTCIYQIYSTIIVSSSFMHLFTSLHISSYHFISVHMQQQFSLFFFFLFVCLFRWSYKFLEHLLDLER